MILRELLELLGKIATCHPEAENADVWAIRKPDSSSQDFPIQYVGYDRRHKPPRIKLEQ